MVVLSWQVVGGTAQVFLHPSSALEMAQRIRTPLTSVNVASAGEAQLHGSNPIRSSTRGAKVPRKQAPITVTDMAIDTATVDMRVEPGVT